MKKKKKNLSNQLKYLLLSIITCPLQIFRPPAVLWLMQKESFERINLFLSGSKTQKKKTTAYYRAKDKDCYYLGQIYGGDFAKICDLLRINEL